MRPTITEQLAGTCRILEEVVAPELAGAQAADALRGLVKNLRMLETSWSSVLPFLHWDNDATAGLLGQARRSVPSPLAERIDTACAETAPDPIDLDAVHSVNNRLRNLLSEVVLVLDPAEPAHAGIVAHLAARTARYPMRMVPDMPSGAGTAGR